MSSANEREQHICFLAGSTMFMVMHGSPLSSRQVRSPTILSRRSISALGLSARSKALCMPILCMRRLSRRPMPHTSSMLVSRSALRRFSSLSIIHTAWYAGYFLAKSAAILASVFVGAMPSEVGMPVLRLTRATMLRPKLSRVSGRQKSRFRKASSIEYISMSLTIVPRVAMTRPDMSPYRRWLPEKAATPLRSHNSLTWKNGLPRFSPRALASLLSATMQPSLLLRTTTGLWRKAGINTRSHDTKKLLQSMSPIIVGRLNSAGGDGCF